MQTSWNWRSFAIVMALAGVGPAFVSPAFGQAAAPIAKHENWVTTVLYSADGATLVTAGGQSLQYRPGDVKLWDAKSGNAIASLEGQSSNVWGACLSPDGKTLVTTGYDGKIVVFDVAEKKAKATLEKKGWIRAAAFSSQGKFATAGEDGNVTVWDAAENKEAKSFKAHDTAVYAVAFSPDGNTLATASTDKTAKLFDWQNGKEIAKLEGHTDAVWTIAYSAAGDRLATGGADRTVRLWDATGKSVALLVGHKDWVSQVAFTKDGQTLASSSLDRTVKVWNLGQAVAVAPKVDEAAKKLAEARTAADTAANQAREAEAPAKAATAKATAVAAITKSKQDAEAATKAKADADGDKENKDKAKAATDAKAAADKAAAEAEEKIKAVTEKEFADAAKKLKEGDLANAMKELEAANKAMNDAAEKVKTANAAKEAAEKSALEAKAALDKVAEEQATTFGPYASTVWAVAFSPDGKSLATGSHKQIRIWDLAGKKELFPAPAEEKKPAK